MARELRPRNKSELRKERVDPRAEVTLGYRRWDQREMGQDPKEKA